MLSISPLQPTQLDQAARTVVNAFIDYPMFTCYFRDAAQRSRKLTWYLRNALKVAMRYGEVLATADLAGVIFTLLPGHTTITDWEYLRCGYATAPLVLGVDDFARSQVGENAVNKAHAELMQDQPHYYLWGLTVDPLHKAQGYGKAMLAQLIEKAQASQLPIYLETHTEKNVAYYQNLGFECLHKATIDSFNLPFWCLRWTPTQA